MAENVAFINTAAAENIGKLQDGLKQPTAQVINYQQIADMGLDTSHGTTVKKLANGAEVDLGDLKNIQVKKVPKTVDLPKGLSVETITGLTKKTNSVAKDVNFVGNDVWRVLQQRAENPDKTVFRVEVSYEGLQELNKRNPYVYSKVHDNLFQKGATGKNDPRPTIWEDTQKCEESVIKINNEIVQNFPVLAQAFPEEAAMAVPHLDRALESIKSDVLLGDRCAELLAGADSILNNYKNENLKANNQTMVNYMHANVTYQAEKVEFKNFAESFLEANGKGRMGDICKAYMASKGIQKPSKDVKDMMQQAYREMRKGGMRTNPEGTLAFKTNLKTNVVAKVNDREGNGR